MRHIYILASLIKLPNSLSYFKLKTLFERKSCLCDLIIAIVFEEINSNGTNTNFKAMQTEKHIIQMFIRFNITEDITQKIIYNNTKYL